MEENWIAYARIIEDTPAVIGVDLQFAESAPDEERPTALRAAVGFLDVMENGLPRGDDELEFMQGIEDALVKALEPTGAVFVGRRSHGGEREFFFYGPGGDAARAAAAEVLEAYEGRERAVDAAADPEWEYYFEELLPEPMEMRRVFDEMVVEQFEEEGDPLVVPRPVTHFVYFTDTDDRERFAAASVAGGFQAEAFEDEEAEDGEVYGLNLERVDAIDLEHITEVTAALMEAAEEAGGRYDGWEAEIVRAEGDGGEDEPR